MARMSTEDLVKEHPEAYRAGREPEVVTITRGRFLAVDGVGEPGGEGFARAIEALYDVAWTLRTAIAKPSGRDFRLAPLETIYRSVPARAREVPDPWRWTMLLRVPDWVRARDLAGAVRSLKDRGRGDELGLDAVRVETLREGRCVQALHVGPYDAETTTVAKMLATARANGFAPAGGHHEIYVSDPDRIGPERLRTVIRLRVAKRRAAQHAAHAHA